MPPSARLRMLRLLFRSGRGVVVFVGYRSHRKFRYVELFDVSYRTCFVCLSSPGVYISPRAFFSMQIVNESFHGIKTRKSKSTCRTDHSHLMHDMLRGTIVNRTDYC